MTDAEPLFIDTNILIYANVANTPQHERALSAIKAAHQAGRALWISRQVLREFIAARARPQTFAQLSTPLSYLALVVPIGLTTLSNTKSP